MRLIALPLLLLLQIGCAAEKRLDESGPPLSTEPFRKAELGIGAGPSTPATTLSDYQYEWDEINHRGRMIWLCRGAQTGKLIDESVCSAKPKADVRWPDKAPPAQYREFRPEH